MRYVHVIAVAVLAVGVQQAAADNLPDPTRPAGMGASSAVSGRSALQTTIVSPGRSLAVINGRTIGVGDTVGDAVVLEIRPYEVVLKSRAGVKVMRMVPPLTRSVARTASEPSIEP